VGGVPGGGEDREARDGGCGFPRAELQAGGILGQRQRVLRDFYGALRVLGSWCGRGGGMERLVGEEGDECDEYDD
jgi:hypothetical protein